MLQERDLAAPSGVGQTGWISGYRKRTAAVLALGCTVTVVLAAGPADKDEAFIGARRNYWAFRKPVRPDVPPANGNWVRNPIDAFIFENLQAHHLEPSPRAEREQLLRRAYLDVIGLPPTPEEIKSFLDNRSPDAYANLIDRLMASPHYGERIGLKWLDVVRYADTNGFEADGERPNAWRYRDYVVRAFNTGKPYDRFIEEQLAGDELYPGDTDALLGLGFLRCGPRHIVGGNVDPEMLRQEQLVEMAGSVGSTFLGVTIGCARCHNHKFDPILQADYYRIQAIFAGTEMKDIDISAQAEKIAREEREKEYETRLKPITGKIAEIEKPYRQQIEAAKRAQLDGPHAAAMNTPKDKRTPEQQTLAKEAQEQIKIAWDEIVQALNPEDRQRRAELRREMHRIELDKPDPLPAAFAVSDTPNDPPTTYVLKVGDYHSRLDPVEPGFLKVLAPWAQQAPPGAAGRRAALAKWIASPDNPLTARVIVNRIWELRMGSGLVKTPNDFGLLGGNPSNSRLLDWLAVEFVSHGWSVKYIDRLILLSATYQQSATIDAANVKIDPDNRFYWRMNRRRLNAESLRDSVLQVSGLLNPKISGKPVRIPVEPEVAALVFTEGEPDNLWPVTPDESEHYRRSLYLLNKRSVRLPLLANFDQPDDMTSCPVRPVSTHSLQALSLMNGGFMQDQSQAFAARLERECRRNRACEVRLAYQLALARAPKPQELQMARRFFAKDRTLSDFCLAMLNRNDFAYIP
jgi:hypothetical protein